MGLYNFQKRFVPFILSGEKTHTIRALRAHPDKPGNTLHLYSGLRTKKAKLLMRVPCVKVETITFTVWRDPDRDSADEELEHVLVTIDGNTLYADEKDAFARSDGFKDFADMVAFWRARHGVAGGNTLPFNGQIIHWKCEAPKPKEA